MSDDPFQEAQADVLSLLQQTRPLLQSYLRIRSTASSANAPELREARDELENNITDLSTDLSDLVDSVKAVEGDPYRYGIDVAEVGRRRKLVKDVGDEIDDMRRQMQSAVAAADAKHLAHPDQFGMDDDEDEGEEDYAAWEEQRQMELIHEQDEALDGVFQTVGNLRAQADTMGRELEEQAELLEDTENITDRVGGKLATGMKKIRYVIEKNEGEMVSGQHRDAGQIVIAEIIRTDRCRRSLFKLLYCSIDIRAHTAAHNRAGGVRQQHTILPSEWRSIRYPTSTSKHPPAVIIGRASLLQPDTRPHTTPHAPHTTLGERDWGLGSGSQHH